jgi:hypothetical protein
MRANLVLKQKPKKKKKKKEEEKQEEEEEEEEEMRISLAKFSTCQIAAPANMRRK